MKILALAGGVGGAKLADGLAHVLPPEDLTLVVNTGDDFEHWGLRICPDLDTVCYTLAGLANPETGWGRKDESWKVLQNMQTLEAQDWFRLGDQDLATHLERTRRLNSGQTLSEVTKSFCESWKIKNSILPMCDQPVSTIVNTRKQGELAFQEYFVHQRCAPEVTGFHFAGIENALINEEVLDAIENADAIILCPSNPWVSIDPILAVGDFRARLEQKTVIAVSPIIAGNAIKGPAAKMFSELGLIPSALTVARHYGKLLTGFVFDALDADLSPAIAQTGVTPLVTQTLMKTTQDRQKLATDVLNFAGRFLSA